MSLIVVVPKDDWEGEFFVAESGSEAVNKLLDESDAEQVSIYQRAFPEQEEIIISHFMSGSKECHFKVGPPDSWYIARTVA